MPEGQLDHRLTTALFPNCTGTRTTSGKLRIVRGGDAFQAPTHHAGPQERLGPLDPWITTLFVGSSYKAAFAGY